MQEAAHAIKGTVGNFGAPAASDAAHALEVMGKDGVLTAVGAGVARLELEVGQLVAELGAAAFLRKPVDPQTLHETLLRVVGPAG